MEPFTIGRLRKLSRLPLALNHATVPWTCAPCQRRAGSVWQRRLASTQSSSAPAATSPKKPFYVTTPIFYVNSSPHVGHLFTLVLADVFKRWKVLQGEKALLCTGTDEHGMKIQRAADASEMSPQDLCDANSAIFANLAKRARIENDFFIRTTDPDHKEAVQYFWDRLWERGYIYEASHQGWYCVSEETFYPESTIEKRQHPVTGKVFLASKETGSAVEWTEEKTYHFRLTAFKDRLLKFFEENPEWIVPTPRMKEVVDWVQNNLEDLSVSRPTSRLSWGIRVPGDESQTIYVWIDALINYLTKSGYPHWTPETQHDGGWPADVQIIGKDIMRFHCVYWPALLMALDLPLPKRILIHAHWTLGGRKMSKSIGNVVDPFLAIDRFGIDTVRYFLILHGRLLHDSVYDNHILTGVYKKQLQNGVGNLLGRVMRSIKWNIPEILQTYGPPHPRPQSQRIEILVFRDLVEELPAKVAKAFEDSDAGGALLHIVNHVVETNRFMTDLSPWTFPATQKNKTKMLTIYLAAESLRIMGIMLQVFMPDKSAQLLDMMGVEQSRRNMAYASLGADVEYGTPIQPVGCSGTDSGLFPGLVSVG